MAHEGCHGFYGHPQKQMSIYTPVFHPHGIGQDGHKQHQSNPQPPCVQSKFEMLRKQAHKPQSKQIHWHVPKRVCYRIAKACETLRPNQTRRLLPRHRYQYLIKQPEHQAVQWLHEKSAPNLHKRSVLTQHQAMHHGARACHEWG